MKYNGFKLKTKTSSSNILKKIPLLIIVLVALVACIPKPAPVTDEQAARLLTQATFGPTDAEIDAITSSSIEEWIDNQLTLQGPTHFSLLNEAMGDTPPEDVALRHLQSAWWKASLTNPDQLRQRVAFALSEILVISKEASMLGPLKEYGLAHYYDTLVTHAFGNYRNLIEDVTLNPMMGRYLSMRKNKKPNAAKFIHPDENYAREVMQLFTIGLIQLNNDGSAKLDVNQQEIPTYTQEDIEGLAHVFTGWTDYGSKALNSFSVPLSLDTMTNPMENYAKQHDTNEKQIIGGVKINAGLTGEQELTIALDTLFNHPNVGPFISKQLIQRLVTSNPSPAYVNRVANAFNKNAQGVRGDLTSVIKAILLDDEARKLPNASDTSYGKLKEPILRQTNLWRAFNARSGNGLYTYASAKKDFGQAALESDTVFNFFRPDHLQSGALAKADKRAPEFQITNESQMTTTANRFIKSINKAHTSSHSDNTIFLDLSAEHNLATDPQALIERINLLLMAGNMSDQLKQELVTHIETIDAANINKRVSDAIYFTMTSAEQAVQR